MKKYSVEGCYNECIAKELCWKHYRQMLRHDKLTLNSELGYYVGCFVEDCLNKHYVNGYYLIIKAINKPPYSPSYYYHFSLIVQLNVSIVFSLYTSTAELYFSLPYNILL